MNDNARGQLPGSPSVRISLVPVIPTESTSLVTQTGKNLLAMQETGSDPWVGKIPWRRKRQPTPVFLPGESPGQRSLVSYSPCGHKKSDTTERLTVARVRAKKY